MRELDAATGDGTVPDAVLDGDEPVVLRGLVAHWPAVREGLAGPGRLTRFLRAHDGGARVGLWRGPPEIDGRFDYDASVAGFNFTREIVPLPEVLDLLDRHRDDARPPAVYVGSTTIDTCLPRWRADHDLAPALLERLAPLASLWLGNRTRVALHQDLPDNLACVVAGRRRFTLLPPDQVGQLYVGPLEHTLAGQPTSLVDHEAPDLARFPRFAAAMAHAQVAELDPGDAVFVPSMWWHGVTALAPVNLLVNYWWRRSPAHMDSPMGALLHALMTVRDLPPAQRAAWRALFDHYVFDADAETAAHLPPAARQVLGPIDEATARGLRARLQRRLNR